MGELNLWLDSYDDIYSDFDSRHYLKRRMSDDFLYELRTEMKYKEQHPDNIALLLPKEQRNEDAEKMVADSLIDFFTNRFRYYQDKCRKKMNKGLLLIAIGIIIMLLNLWINYYWAPSFFITALKVLLEPAGWFLLWTSLDILFYDYAEVKKEREFYKNLSETHILFKSS
jgi:hypothetical protein